MRQENLVALELDRRHIGLLVKVVTDSLSIIGKLERVQHDDNMDLTWDWRPVRRDIHTRLRISGWEGPVNPQQVVTVEWPEPVRELPGIFEQPAIAGELVEEPQQRKVPCGPRLNGGWHCNVPACSRPEDERCALRMLEELGEGQPDYRQENLDAIKRELDEEWGK